MDVTFRRLTDADLPLLHGWLNEPGVVRWWEGDDVSWDGVVREYGSSNPDPVEHWLALQDGVPFGWIQCYATSAFEDEDETRAWRRLGVPATAAGIDYLVGDPDRRGSGLGSTMIHAFVEHVVAPHHPTWSHVGASPDCANVASVRALEKAGFVDAGSWTDAAGRRCCLRIRRLEGPGRAG